MRKQNQTGVNTWPEKIDTKKDRRLIAVDRRPLTRSHVKGEDNKSQV